MKFLAPSPRCRLSRLSIASLLVPLSLIDACSGNSGGSTLPDGGSAMPTDGGSVDSAAPDANAFQPDVPRPDVFPLYACPSALGSPDGGLLPSRRPTTPAAPTLAAPLVPGALPATDVVFAIDTSQGMWPISPDIYGMNSPGPRKGVDPTLRVTSERLGGNRLSAFNWENNASNAGKDYYYQNDSYLSSSKAAGDAVRFVLDDAWATGAGAVVTVPIGDYVSADKSPGGDVRNSTDYLTNRFRKNVASKGAPLTYPPNQDDDSVYQDEFVAWAKGCGGDLPLAFCLDNEPDLWSETHPEIHADKVTFAELCQRTVTFASAIKAVWPAAPVLGFVSYGWNGFTTLQGAPDQAKRDFVEFFLGQMQAAEATAGKRLVDYLDLHWYPEAKGGTARIVFDSAPTDATNLAANRDARVQAPRSLWDATYKEDSWIANNAKVGPINLIHRMQQKIAANYSGTKLSFTEWNYGGGSDITGAIATADVLGIFGRERVDMAHIWLLDASEPFTFAGVRTFRNYDGQSGEFGDIGIAATNSDTVNTSVYASLSSSNPNQVVVVAINKKGDASVTAGIRLAHPTNFESAKVYQLMGSKADLVAAPALAASAPNAFTYAMPPRSVSVLVFSGSLATSVDGGASVDGGMSADGGALDAEALNTSAVVDAATID